jgi:hypothetical protein
MDGRQHAVPRPPQQQLTLRPLDPHPVLSGPSALWQSGRDSRDWQGERRRPAPGPVTSSSPS